MKKLLLVVLGLGAIASFGTLIYINTNSTKKGPRFAQNSYDKTEPGLVVYWSFDEGKGKKSVDLSGNNIEARINGATWVEGKKGTALEFDGNDDYVEVEQSGLKMVGELEYGTISLWFKFAEPKPKRILPIFHLGANRVDITVDSLLIEIGHFDHGDKPDQKIYYTVYNRNYEPVLCFDSGFNLKANTWYHFAVVNGPNGNTGYLNGKELINRHYNFGSSANTEFFNILHKKDTFKLGYGWFGIDQKFHYFDGVIDEVRIYNQPLNAERIKDLADL